MNAFPSQPQRTFVPVAADQRPVRVRRTARVLLEDDSGGLLLFADSDPGLPGSRWWITPGGGVEPGENDRAAAVREVAEETGMTLTVADLVGPVAVRRAVHGYTDVIVDQVEVFFGATVARFDLDDSGYTEEERLTITAHRWWTPAELEAIDDSVWPTGILTIWEEFRWARRDPARLPLDLGRQEESTVPVDRDLLRGLWAPCPHSQPDRPPEELAMGDRGAGP